MPDLYPLVRPLLWRLDEEIAHQAALFALRADFGFFTTTREAKAPDSLALRQSLWGLTFPNPIGVAAGFDKDAQVAKKILKYHGYGAVEVGTVTPRPQRGNPGRRLCRDDIDGAIVNSMGFPSAGLDVVVRRLSNIRPDVGVLGVNLGKNKDTESAAADYVEGIKRTSDFADYLVINISSPNTPGLRDLQRREPLRALLHECMTARDNSLRRPPLLLKVAPDLTGEECEDIAEVTTSLKVDGIIISNTTTSRPDALINKNLPTGGLSGKPLFRKSTEILFRIYQLTSGTIPLIGVGGVSTAEEAYRKIQAGASLIQIHSAIIFGGMSIIGKIKSGLIGLLERDGFHHISEAVGVAHRDRKRACDNSFSAKQYIEA